MEQSPGCKLGEIQAKDSKLKDFGCGRKKDSEKKKKRLRVAAESDKWAYKVVAEFDFSVNIGGGWGFIQIPRMMQLSTAHGIALALKQLYASRLLRLHPLHFKLR